MFKHNLTATINTQRPDKNGKVPVRIRATIKRKVTYYQTGIMVLPEQWDNSKKEIIKHPNRSLLNAAIREKITEIEKQFLEQNIMGVQENKIKSVQTSFYDYAFKKITDQTATAAKGTTTHRWSYLNKFHEFAPNIKLHECTPAVLAKFETYCRDLGNQGNTIWSSVKFVKTVINAALKDGTLSKNPSIGFNRTKYKSPEIEFLTETEMNKIEKFTKDPEQSESLVNVAKWFLFCCYSSLRYSDAAGFTKDKIKNDKITLRTEKTGQNVTIKMYPKLTEIYNSIERPILTNQKSNEYLKTIGKLVKIKKRLNWHLSRHSFAVMFLDRGGSMEALSKILGHSSIKTTQIYGQITNKRLDDEIDKVFS